MDLLEDNGYNQELYTKRDDSLLLDHISGHDNRDEDSYSEYHRYIMFYFFTFETGNKKLSEEFFTVTDYDVEKSILSKSTANIIDLSTMLVFFSLFVYLSYRIIKDLNNIKQKDLLLILIIDISIILSTIFIVYYLYDFIDIDNLGYVNYLSFGYGFYFACLSLILFTISYIFHHNFIKLKNQ